MIIYTKELLHRCFKRNLASLSLGLAVTKLVKHLSARTVAIRGKETKMDKYDFPSDYSEMMPDELLKWRSSIEAKANETYEEWEKLCDLLGDIEERFDEIKRAERDQQRDIDTEQLLQSISHISDDNSMHVRLFSDSATTPIMDRFEKSDKEFLIFDKFCVAYPNAEGTSFRDKKYISLIITRSSNKVWGRDNGLTMTNLKKRSGISLRRNMLQRLTENTENRLYPLHDELLDAYDKIFSGDEYIPFGLPCCLHGQTYANQTGYGNIYNGEDLVEEGTLYGETTEFLILGIRVDPYTFTW